LTTRDGSIHLSDAIELRAPASLSPYARNARTHSPEQIQKLAASIREFGFTNPILVDGTGTVVAGHARLSAALELGLEQVPTIELRHLSDAQRRAYVLADNRLALDAGWDEQLLAEELAALADEGFGLEVVGFSDTELAALLEPELPEETVPPVPDTPVSTLGDLWILGEHRVLCGDATDADVLERVLAGRSAACVWTDPPYNVAVEGAAGAILNDSMSEEAFAKFLKATFEALIAAMAPGAPIYVAHSDTGGYTFRRAFIEAGFHLASCLIWRKNSLVLSHADHHWQHEPILYGWKPGESHPWFGGRDKTTILEFEEPAFQQVGDNAWQIVIGQTVLIVRGEALTVEGAPGTVFLEDKPVSSPEHPTMKPVALVARMLRNSARRGAIVLDPFGGSGSTLMACEALGMRARLVELDPRFVAVIIRRWQNVTGAEATLEGDGRKFAAVATARARRAG
jgi:DNA modification methylase